MNVLILIQLWHCGCLTIEVDVVMAQRVKVKNQLTRGWPYHRMYQEGEMLRHNKVQYVLLRYNYLDIWIVIFVCIAQLCWFAACFIQLKSNMPPFFFLAWAPNEPSACEDWRRIVLRGGSFSWIWWGLVVKNVLLSNTLY